MAAMFTAHWCTLLVIMQGSCMVPWAAAEPAGEHCQDDAVSQACQAESEHWTAAMGPPGGHSQQNNVAHHIQLAMQHSVPCQVCLSGGA